jgi:hypothetical protein
MIARDRRHLKPNTLPLSTRIELIGTDWNVVSEEDATERPDSVVESGLWFLTSRQEPAPVALYC